MFRRNAVTCSNRQVNDHYVKSVQIRSFSGPHFPVFSSNTTRYGTEKNPYLDTFHSVDVRRKKWICCQKLLFTEAAVLRRSWKKVFWNMQQICRRTPTSKCDFVQFLGSCFCICWLPFPNCYFRISIMYAR